MPAGKLEYGVLYHMEQGPTRETIYDAARLGHASARQRFYVDFVFRGERNDWIGNAHAFVQGLHHAGPNPSMLFIMGQLCRVRDHEAQLLDKIWQRAFFFAHYNLDTYRGRILLGESSFLESPLKQFGPYVEAEPEI